MPTQLYTDMLIACKYQYQCLEAIILIHILVVSKYQH